MTNPGRGKSNLRGIGFLIAGAGCFVLNDSLMKLTLLDVPAFEVLVLRGVFGLICLMSIMAATGQTVAMSAAFNRWVMLRGIFEVAAICSFIISLAKAPIADLTAVFQTTPMLIILGMVLFQGGRIETGRLVLVLLGFAGALLVAQPGLEGSTPYVLLGFVTAFFAAARDLAGRHIPTSTPVLVSTLVTVVMVLVAFFAAGIIFERWLMPSAVHLLRMAAAGLLMAFGHVFTFLAYRHADAQAVAPFYYSFMFWALICGYLLFNTVPNSLALIGMALILISGIAIVGHEKRKA